MHARTLSRRSFIKACGVIAGYAVLSGNMIKEAWAASMEFVHTRQKSVYNADQNLYKFRKSQSNPMIKKLYHKKNGFLQDGPCGHKSHELLHTSYTNRSARLEALKKQGLNFSR